MLAAEQNVVLGFALLVAWLLADKLAALRMKQTLRELGLTTPEEIDALGRHDTPLVRRYLDRFPRSRTARLVLVGRYSVPAAILLAFGAWMFWRINAPLLYALADWLTGKTVR